MAASNPKRSLILRWAAFGWAVIFFVWIPIEDTTIFYVLALSAGWCALVAVWRLPSTLQSGHRTRQLLSGAGYGLAVSPFALILVLVKAGTHNHGFLDFTNTQLVQIIKTTPAWIAMGLLVVGVYLWSNSRQPPPE